MVTPEEFIAYLRDALNHLYEPDRLRNSPLAHYFGVANRVDTFGRLRDILTAAIEALEPPNDVPPNSPDWEIYEPLYYRYVRQLTQRQVAIQLGMSVRHLRRKEHAALQVLASHLWEQYNLSDQAPGHVGEQKTSQKASSEESTAYSELAWLRDAPLDTPVSLEPTLREVLQLATPAATRLGTVIAVKLATDLPMLAIHSLALRQALLSLITFAIYQAPGHEIEVCAHTTSDGITLVLRTDRSMPIHSPLPQEQIDRLELARWLLDISGGSIRYPPSGPSHIVELRVPAVGHIPVLIVDDNPDTLQLLRRYSAGTRYKILTVSQPEQIFSVIETSSPRIIILDVMMPNIDGWKLLGELRRHPLTLNTPIIVCTVLPHEALAYDLGATAFLRKPVTRQQFIATLDQQMRTTV